MKEKHNLHRDNWADNIEQILEASPSKNDEAVLYDFMDDSDLESMQSPHYPRDRNNLIKYLVSLW